MSGELNPDTVQTWYDEGSQAYWAGDYPRALANLEAFTKAAPDDVAGWVYLDRTRALMPDFAQRLREQGGSAPSKRIFVLGCGRSGTWLVTAMMECFADVFVLGQEAPVGRFLRLDAAARTHVVKREWCAYETAHLIPDAIDLLYVIRFPLDVLVSRHVEEDYWIKPDRWRNEMQALRLLLEQQRSNLRLVRYEDLVAQPDLEQVRLAAGFGLQIRTPFSQFHNLFSPSELIRAAMNGVRPPALDSIGRWRSQPKFIEYCRSIWPEIGEDVAWVCERFGYDRPSFLTAELPAIEREQS